MNILRWLLTVPSTYLALLISSRYGYVGTYDLGSQLLCPGIPKYDYLSPCIGTAQNVAFCSMSFTFSCLFVLIPSVTAPSHRLIVARIAFVPLLALACILAVGSLIAPVKQGLPGPALPNFYWPFYDQTLAGCILLGGGLSLWIIQRFLTHHSSGTPNSAP